MFGNYVYEMSSAQYENRILLIDEDNLEGITNYSTYFFLNGFEVIKYTDDLRFRIDYEEKLKRAGDKILVVARSEKYIPYDIRLKLRTCIISLSNLFPKLNVGVIKEKSIHDIDLVCLAYKTDFEDRRLKTQTEEFLRTKVYTKVNVKNYLLYALPKLMSKMEDSYPRNELISMTKGESKYKEWFAIAEGKSKLDVLAIQYDIEIETAEINHRFKNYALTQFGKLSQIIDKDTPVLVSRAMEYMHENSSRFIIIVMDGMSEFDWNIIRRSFYDIPYVQEAVFAMIPTTTSVSRQCLLSNKYPSQLIEPWKQSKEKYEFIVCLKELGYTDEQIGYARGYNAEFSLFVRCGAVIINDVDDIVHSQKQGRLGMFNDITVLKNQSKLANLTKRFLKANYDVYITADHGNTQCIGLGKLMGTGVEVETKSRRMLVLNDFADKEVLLKKYRLLEYPKYYLTKDYDYLICDVGDSFDAKGEAVISHGGITLDEVVVPFIKIKAVKSNG